MQFTLASVLSLLAAAEVVSAWQIIAYNDGRAQCDGRQPNRVLRGGNNQSGCMTFGRAMPGVTCTQWPGPQGCHGNMPVNSIRVGTGESCTFYSDANCSRDPYTVHRVNDCASNEGAGWGSYKCRNA